jgi:hypothetical protein
MVVLNADNSFVTFYNLSNDQGADYFITDTECGIQKDFCYPIYDEKDLLFQTNIISSEVLTSDNIDVQRIPSSGTGVTLTGVSLQINQVGLYQGTTPIYNVYFSFFSSDLTQGLDDGDCFRIGIIAGGSIDLAYFVSNQCFKKVNDKLIEDNLKLKKNFIDAKLEIEACQDHCAKLRDQQLIIIKRQKLFRDKLIPQKIIIESSKDLSKQYEKTFSKIKTQLGEL